MEAKVNCKGFLENCDCVNVRSLEKVDISELVRHLKKNPQLKKIYIEGCIKIKREECKELSSIKSLDLISVKITDANDENIKVLSEITNLTFLYVEKHCLTSEGVKELSKCANLTKLVVQECTIEKINDQHIKEISFVYVESLAKLTNLTELKLKDNFINDEFVELLANTNGFQNLKRLELSETNIGNKSASALAKSLNSPNLTHLILKNTNISIEGAKELALSYKLKNLQMVDLDGSDLHDVGVIEELSKITYSRTQPRFRLSECLDRLHNLLREVLSNKMTIDNISESTTLCTLTKGVSGQIITKYLLSQTEKYQIRLNSVLKGTHAHCTFFRFPGEPFTEKFLFELGALPAAISIIKPNEKTALQVITKVCQSVHMTPVVKKTNFFTKYLVDSVNATKEQVEQEVHSFAQNIPSFFQRYQSDPIRLKLLNLTDSEKICVLENTLSGLPLPSDKEFVGSVIRKAKTTLERLGNFSDVRMHYDYTKSDATVTIPQCIGYIKLLIDTFSVPLDEKVELLVAVMEQNPNLVKDKLLREHLDRPQLYESVKNMTSENIGKLFLFVCDLDIEQIWREQKEFVLLKQICISETAYDEDDSACAQGILSQIVASLDEIDLKLLNRYEPQLDEENESERFMPIINEDNSSRLANALARKLIEHSAFRPRVRKSLEEFVFGMIDMKNFENITFEQQKLIAHFNRDFTCNVKKFLPNYEREIPTEEEYDVIIQNVLKSKTLQDFAKSTPC